MSLTTARVWVAQRFEDEQGWHRKGSVYEYPVATEVQRARFAALMAQGLLTERNPHKRRRSPVPAPTRATKGRGKR